MDQRQHVDLLSVLSAEEPPAELDLNGLVFGEAVRISGITIKTFLNIGDAVFHGPVSFAGCTFLEEVNIFRTRFIGHVTFENCTFEKMAAFRPKEMLELNLTSSVFKDDVEVALPDDRNAKLTMQYATVHKVAEIKSLSYGTPLYLRHVKFNAINLGEMVVESNASLTISGVACQKLFANKLTLRDKSNCLLQDVRPKAMYFHDIQVPASAMVTLVRVSLDKAFFTGTNIEKFRMLNVSWRIFKGREALWQEALLRTKPKTAQRDERSKSLQDLFEEVAENYRQLVLNYEAQRNYELAEKFHIGEMELTRLRQAERLPRWLGRLRGVLNLHWLYWISSGYGTNYGRAALALIVILLAFSVGFMFSGIRMKDHTEIAYSLNVFRADLRAPPVAEILRDATAAGATTLSIVTLQKERPADPVGVRGSVIVSLLSMFASAQATLFVFALRRRFRRASI